MKVIIDFDPGVDDVYALMFAMLYSKMDILCLTTVNGNVNEIQAFVNAHLAVEKLYPTNYKIPPIYAGGKDPIVFNKGTDNYFGPDGLAGATVYVYKIETENIRNNYLNKNQLDDNHAALKIIELVNKYPNEVHIIALAPLTNLALALRLGDSDFTRKIAKVSIMGGSEPYGFSQFPITTQFNYPEFNFAIDPIAAKLVLDEYLCPMTIYTIDFTERSFFIDFGELMKEMKKNGNNKRVKFIETLAILSFNRVGDKKTNLFFSADLSAMIGILYGDELNIEKRNCNCTVEIRNSTTAGLILDAGSNLGSKIEMAIIMDPTKSKDKFKTYLKKLAYLI
jgi:inosine-uridine nucleoside N-ribohydrolase